MLMTEIRSTPAFDRTRLQSRGWAEFNLTETTEQHLRERLITFAAQFGTPVAMRAGVEICETLKPTETRFAQTHSLSKIHSLGEFPLHVDTAHWLTPCRFLILACLSPGSGHRQTTLLDTNSLPLSHEQTSLLRSAPLRIANGRNSFFSTILAKHRPFVRFDTGCMTPVTPNGEQALDVFSINHWTNYVEAIDWHEGKVAIIDNWRILHGRGRADRLDDDRTLLRISIR